MGKLYKRDEWYGPCKQALSSEASMSTTDCSEESSSASVSSVIAEPDTLSQLGWSMLSDYSSAYWRFEGMAIDRLKLGSVKNISSRFSLYHETKGMNHIHLIICPRLMRRS